MVCWRVYGKRKKKKKVEKGKVKESKGCDYVMGVEVFVDELKKKKKWWWWEMQICV